MSMSAGQPGGQYLEVDQVHTGPGPQQLHHHVIVGLAAGQVQGGLAVTVEHVQLRPGAAHQPHDDAVTLECRVVQRPPARVIPVILIQAPVKQNLNKIYVLVLHKTFPSIICRLLKIQTFAICLDIYIN